jgi:hypothetical protein
MIVIFANPTLRTGVTVSQDQRVVLGLGGAWGFAPGDLTSPARAAEAGAFTDAGFTAENCGELDGLTELRVHGVSGSNGPAMLEHPTALQVDGDSTTSFFRRWTPAGFGGAGVPWKLEAYSWGGLTEKPLASASWLLMSPFMFYNIAHFALPPSKEYHLEANRLSRDRRHAFAQAVLRLLALAATLQFAVGLICILVNGLAVQARLARIPTWLAWFPKWAPEWRLRIAVLAFALIILAMWLVSVKTANRYEARVSKSDTSLNDKWALTEPRFWKGQELVRRQRWLHAGGIFGLFALVLARPSSVHIGALRWTVVAVAAFVLLSVVVLLCLPLADRHDVTVGSSHDHSPRDLWLCRAPLAIGFCAAVAALFTSGWPDTSGLRPVSLPGLTSLCGYLLAAQVFLLLVLFVGVLSMVGRDSTQPTSTRPYAGGHLTTLFAALAICLGGMASAVATLFAIRVIGTPIPSGVHLASATAFAIQIPWPVYIFAAAPLGLVAGVLVSSVVIVLTWRGNVRRFMTPAGGASPVASFYATDADPVGSHSTPGMDDALHARSRLKVARAWAMGLLVDHVALVVGLATVGMVAATSWAAAEALRDSHSSGEHPGNALHGFAAAESLIGLAVAGVLVALLRMDYSNSSKRKTIGALWDVGTFWPRATHPFAPPCYAERAVPELVDRVRVLTGTVTPDASDPAWVHIRAHERDSDACVTLSVAPGPVLLTGYSQGSILAPTVVAQLPAETRSRVALLTLACPARRLYGRAFPAYFGAKQLETLASMLSGTGISPDPARRRWKNLVRRSDYIGSWIFTEPQPANTTTPAEIQPDIVDQPCWDPVALVADLDPTPPPIHYHSGFWQDPRVTQLGRYLGGLLAARELPTSVTIPSGRSPADSEA